MITYEQFCEHINEKALKRAKTMLRKMGCEPTTANAYTVCLYHTIQPMMEGSWKGANEGKPVPNEVIADYLNRAGFRVDGEPVTSENVSEFWIRLYRRMNALGV